MVARWLIVVGVMKYPCEQEFNTMAIKFVRTGREFLVVENAGSTRCK